MKIWGLGQISPEEKSDILSKHREIYNGYKTMLPQVSNTQPLYVQDYANDKNGLVVNNKGEVKQYTNMGINEQYFNNIGIKAPTPKKARKAISKIENLEEICDECGAMEMSEGECSECGGMMAEGECSECGWKGEVGAMEEEFDDELEFGDEDMEVGDEVSSFDTDGNFLGAVKPNPDMEIEKPNFRPGLDLGKSFEKLKGMMEATGKLSDIYNVEDLGDSDFDYVEGGGNDYGTFEKMHHMKKIKSEGEYEDPDNEDDGFEDLQAGESEMYEQGYTGGGNAPDNSKSLIKPAYDFVSDGPGDVYPTEGEMEEQCLDCVDEYETMESAWSDDELGEANDISGVQGIYGDMEPAYDFDSTGPGKAGPYQRSSWGEGEMEEQFLPIDVWDDAHKKGHVKTHKELGIDSDNDFDEDELEVDFDKFDPRDKSWEEITAHTGEDEFSHLDEDIKESFLHQKNKITEMFNRMKVIK